MAARRRFVPLRDYGLIGDQHTAALVSREGSVDWWCPGRFDAPSAFARILDPERGGHLRVAPPPDETTRSVLAYVPETNVLRAEHETGEGAVEVHDFMPVDEAGRLVDGRSRIVRLATCTRGRVELDVDFVPRPGYARERPDVLVEPGGGARGGDVVLSTDAALEPRQDGSAAGAHVELDEGDAAAFVVEARPGAPAPFDPLDDAQARALLDTTRRFWSAWAERCTHEGPYGDAVVRSALTLKMLQHGPTGALVAAPTTSLPERWGGERNWDYRFSWVRDTAFAAIAFHQAGHAEDATRLAGWVGGLLKHVAPNDLRILYRVDGDPNLEEKTLDHLSGYRDSRPVRVGNGAIHQWQLDVFGELVECLHVTRVLGASAEETAEWAHLRGVIEYVRRNWRRPDHGIWEMRRPPSQHVISNAMAFVALDRGIHAIERFDLPGPLDEWRAARDEIRASVLEEGYDEEVGAFVQAYGRKALDAANLLLPLLGLLPPDDPRMRSTVEKTMETLVQDGLVRRYLADDGLPGNEGAFTICTFWLVELLATMGRVEEARRIMDRMVELGGPLGLHAEQIDPSSGEQMGNYPQALSHVGLISAATAIARAHAEEDEASLHRHLSRIV